MYSLLSNKDFQKPEKFILTDGTNKLQIRNGKGEQQFENGCIYRGEFLEDCIHGQGEFIFPEQSSLTGFFDNNHFRKGTITLSIGIKLSCVTETDYETYEDFLKEFRVQLAPDCFLIGSTNNRGQLEKADVFLKNESVATFANTNLVYKIPTDQKTFLIVSRLWFYIGEIMNSNIENHVGQIFNGHGTQIWYSGIGYNQSVRQNGQLHGVQLMLRHCSGLQFFRDMDYKQGRFESSITIYNNGLIFTTGEDYFKGNMKIFLLNGNEVEFECSLNDYCSLKMGSLKANDSEEEIRFGEKGNKLIFNFKGHELSLDEFKKVLK